MASILDGLGLEGSVLDGLDLLPERAFRQLRLQQFCHCQLVGSGDEIGGIVNVID